MSKQDIAQIAVSIFYFALSLAIPKLHKLMDAQIEHIKAKTESIKNPTEKMAVTAVLPLAENALDSGADQLEITVQNKCQSQK